MYFTNEYTFVGKHAKYVMELKDVLFDRNVDIFLLAPILGLAYNRKSSIDNSSQDKTKIFGDMMIKVQAKNIFNFRLCVLTSDAFTEEEKKDLAFKYYSGDDEDHKDLFNKGTKIFNQYLLGGVEILYENMLQNNSKYNGKPDDVKYLNDMVKNIVEFIDSYKEISDSIDVLSDDLISDLNVTNGEN